MFKMNYIEYKVTKNQIQNQKIKELMIIQQINLLIIKNRFQKYHKIF